MNGRDSQTGNRQPGGYRSDDDAWDSPRQANQWQSDSNRQTGGGWGYGDDERSTTQGRRESRGWSGQREDGDSRRGDQDYRSQQDYRSSGRSSYGDYGDTSYGQRSYGDRNRYERDRSDRGYRFSGQAGSRDYPARDFDASAGNDYSSFTSEDFGGRDFYSNRSAMTGGMRSSESYRPSYGPGSWGSRDSNRGSEYGGWREYGESRGFLEKAGDEIASWFGSEDAARRREMDHRGRGPSDYTRSDERIREDVNDSLTHDWRVDASSIRVTVKDGEVTLEGTVDSRQAKRRAEDVADDVSGVRHVQNNLRVQDRSGLTAGTSTPGYSHSQTSGTSASGLGSTTTTAGMASSSDASTSRASTSGSSTTGTSGSSSS